MAEIQERFDDVIRQLQFHTRAGSGLARNFWWLSWTFLISIPLLSALITVVAALNKADGGWNSYLLWMGGILTLITTFNSVFKPGERFKEAAEYVNQFGLKTKQFQLEKLRIESVADGSQTVKLFDFLEKIVLETTELVNKYNEWVGKILESHPSSQKP